MSVSEIKEILSYLGAFGAGGVCFIIFGWIAFRSYLWNYLSKKAENLATKEDIASITHEIEAVKLQYSLHIEDNKAKHQLRLAALDARLRVHQEAFTLWRELYNSTHTEDIGKIVLKCQEWWEKNCLYLEPKVREAFVSAYSSAHTHQVCLQDRTNPDRVKENWNRIIGFPNTLFEAIQLPALTETEKGALLKDGNATGQK